MAAPERQFQELNMEDVVPDYQAEYPEDALTESEEPKESEDPEKSGKILEEDTESEEQKEQSLEVSGHAASIKTRKYRITDILDLIAQKCVLLLSLGIFGVLWLYTVRYTQSFKSFDQEYLENLLDSKGSNILWAFGAVILFAILAKVLLKPEEKPNNNKKIMMVLLGATCLYYLVVSLLWIKISHSFPYGDQYYIVSSAEAFQNGNFESLQAGGYMDMAPHQLGLALIVEGLYKIFGNGKYYLYQYVNALFMPLLVLSGYKLTELIFGVRRVCLYYLILMVGCVQLFFYVPYIYGEIGSITLMLLEAWMLAAYCKTDVELTRYRTEHKTKHRAEAKTGHTTEPEIEDKAKIRTENNLQSQDLTKQEIKFYKTRRICYAAGAIAASTLAIMIRENSLIFLIAAIIVLLIHTIRQRNLRTLLCIAGIFLGYMMMTTGVEKLYEARSGIESSDGIPPTAYIAMGLQDQWPGPGWYNNYNKECYQQAGFITIVADSMAKANIQERLNAMWLNKPAGIEFFKQKFQTQWNEPSFEAFWVNYSFEGEMPADSLVMRVFDGDLHTLLSRFMNRYQFVIYSLFLVGALALLFDNKRRMQDLLLIIGILGGFFFSMLWEAKSRYVLPYFVFMIVYAAYGFYVIHELTHRIISRYFARRPEVINAEKIESDQSLQDKLIGEVDDRKTSDKPGEGRILRFRRKK